MLSLGVVARRWRLAVAILASSAMLVTSATPAAADETDVRYKSHMDIGVKLFHDGNYDAALVEFEAAYKERPKAAPLLDEALCHKARFAYPKAIAALEKALAEHASDLDAADKKAAEDAIVELRTLLAVVTVRATPPSAEVRVDGELAKAGAATPVAPGKHVLRASAEGFAPIEMPIEVAAGEKRAVRIDLVPTGTRIVVVSPDPSASIAIDGQIVGTGQWSGIVRVGPHVVSLSAEGDRGWMTTALASAGSTIALSPGRGLPLTLPKMYRIPEPPPPKPPLPVHRGPYAVVEASFGIQSGPTDFSGSAPDGAIALYAGYRFNNVIGLAFLFEYATVSISGQNSHGHFDRGSVKISADRFGANLRVTSRGTSFRFLSNAAIGAELDTVSWHDGIVRSDIAGVDPFARLEEGFEFDLGGVLVGSTVQQTLMLPASLGGELEKPVVGVGIALHIGYGIW